MLIPIARFPFNTKNLIGYLTAVTLECAMGVCLFHFTACIFSWCIGCFLFIVAMVEDIKVNLHSIRKHLKTGGDRSQTLKKVLHFIQLHTDAKQLSV